MTPSRRLSLRATLCLSAPLAVGVATGHRATSTLFAVGALWGISQDGLDSWQLRSRRLLSVVVGAGAGFVLGAALTHLNGDATLLIALFAVVAVGAGIVEASGLAAGGMYLLLGTIVGSGLALSGEPWRPAALVSGGALWVWLAAAVSDRRRRRRAVERDCVADGLDGLAACLQAVGTPAFEQTRRRALRLLDTALDVVRARPASPGDDEGTDIRRCLTVALRGGEVVSYFAGTGRDPPPEIGQAFAGAADALRHESATDALSVLDTSGVAADDGTASSTTAVVIRALAVPDRDSATRRTPRPAIRFSIPGHERLRFGLVLATSIAIGVTLVRVYRGPHSFWLPLAVGFIARPDVGPLIPRALARAVGTLVGVAIAAIVAATGNSTLLLIALSCLMAAAVPWASRRSHVLAVIVFTPIVFVFLSVLGPDQYLFVPRIVDTALGAAIVLVIDTVFWSTAPSLRPEAQLERSRAAVTAYLRCDALTSASERHLRRRAALRAIADARASIETALGEPLARRRPDRALLPELRRLEAAIDAHTVSIIGDLTD